MRRIDWNIRQRKALNEGQVIIGNYKTRNFDASPEAVKLYSNFDKFKSAHLGELCAVDQDKLFDIFKKTKNENSANDVDINAAKELHNSIMYLANKLGMKAEHGYVSKFVSAISSLKGNPKTEYDKSKDKDVKTVDKDDVPNFHISRARKMEHKIKIIEENMYRSLGGTIREILLESQRKKVVARKFRDKDGALRTTKEIVDDKKADVHEASIIGGPKRSFKTSVPITSMKGANDTGNKKLTYIRAFDKEDDAHAHFLKWHGDKVKNSAGHSATSTSAYESYCGHCEKHGKEPLAFPTFNRKLADTGIQYAHIAGRKRYIEVKIDD